MGVALRFLPNNACTDGKKVLWDRRCTSVAQTLHGTVNACTGGIGSDSTKSLLGCEEHGC